MPLIDRADQELTRFAEETGIPFLALEPLFRRLVREEGAELHWRHDGHWNLEGNDRAAAEIGFPVAVKAHGVAHKSDAGLVHLGVGDEAGVLDAFDRITAGGEIERVVVQEMVPGGRELVAGMVRDPVFGPCVMFGLGGVLTEVLDDVTFRRTPLTPDEALEMLDDIRGRRILDGVRGMPPADRRRLAGLLTAVGRIGLDHDEIAEIDLNPVILAGSRPVAADALVVLEA